MGAKAAPTIANLVMGDFEKKHVYTYSLQPLRWFLFIYDIYMLWTHDPKAIYCPSQFCSQNYKVHS